MLVAKPFNTMRPPHPLVGAALGWRISLMVVQRSVGAVRGRWLTRGECHGAILSPLESMSRGKKLSPIQDSARDAAKKFDNADEYDRLAISGSVGDVFLTKAWAKQNNAWGGGAAFSRQRRSGGGRRGSGLGW